MALGEGAAPAVLAAEADGRAFEGQGAEGQGLAEWPSRPCRPSMTSWRFSMKPFSLGCRWKSSGKVVMPSTTRSSSASSTAVRGHDSGELVFLDGGDLLQFPLLALGLRLFVGGVEGVLDLPLRCVRSGFVGHDAFAHAAARRTCVATVGCALILRYIIGWV